MKKKVLLIILVLAVLFVPVYKIQAEKSPEGIQKAIMKSIAFLSRQQERNGDFPSCVCRSLKKDRCSVHKGSVFSTTFILYSLQFLPGNDMIGEILKKGVAFIDSRRETGDLWRFCGTRIDYDLDVISCASYHLETSGYILENKKQIYKNRDKKGVFKTWLRKEEKNDVDGVVNANVLLYLGENEKTASACNWIINTIKKGKEDDILNYYPDSAILFYTVSRAYYKHGLTCVDKEIPFLISKINKIIPRYIEKHDYMNVAFLLNALLNFGYSTKELKDMPDFFVENQKEDGSWESSLFFMAVEPPAEPSSYFYSNKMTTALVIEFLSRIR